MNVVFGLYLDRAPWTYRDSALGAVRLGPLGLTQILQTRLGLSGPDARHSTRIRQYLARLAERDSPEAWFHGSFSVDPWSTAIDLLNMRDELVVNGWTGLAPDGSTAKLNALASLEQGQLPFDRAFADYPLELVHELESDATSNWPLGIARLELQHPRTSFPAIWGRLIRALERRGVNVIEPAPHPGPVGEPDGRGSPASGEPQRQHRGPAAITNVATVRGPSSGSVVRAAGSGSPNLSHRNRVWQYRYATVVSFRSRFRTVTEP